jgi:hypothetical protein
MDLKEIKKRIRSIASKSVRFKIGETGQHELERLRQHPEYKEIQLITWSRNKKLIDKLEAKMIEAFINWKNCDNKKEGSAGKMTDASDKYILYVVFTKKPK